MIMRRNVLGLLLTLFAISSLVLIGCNSGASDDLAGSAVITTNSNVVTLVGYVRDGSQISSERRAAAEMRCSLNSLAGITVFLEKNSNLYGITDANGKYVIQNVPQGVHTLIAEKREGTQITFRARQENVAVSAPSGVGSVELSSQDSTQMISMQASPYSLTLFITDTNNLPLYRAKATIWGKDYYSNASGTIYLSDFPGTDTEAVVSMVGYKTIKVPVSFGDNYNSEIFVKLPKNTETNSAPIVSISYNAFSSSIFKFNDILYIRPNERVDLYAKGYDADRDSISYEWSAIGGGFSGSYTGSSVSFIASSSAYKAVVVLVGRDSKNEIGKAELEFLVYGGSAPIATDTPPVATDTPVIATDTPPVATDTPVIATDTPPVATDTPIIATDTPPVATDTPIIATDTRPIATDTPIIATDTPPIATDTPPIATDTPIIATDTPPIATDTPPIATDTPIIATDTPPIATDTPVIGSGSQDIGSGTPRQ
jgi:hypothetical protein